MLPPTRLVVLYGGRSAEHDVSCVSARHVVDALDPRKYHVHPIGITRSGQWVDARRMVANASPALGTLPSPDDAAPADRLGTVGITGMLGGVGRVVVFPLVHGPTGEDGTLQGLLEMTGVPYVGAGVLSSALCMHKGVAKEVLAYHGIAQTPWRCARSREITEDVLDRVFADLGPVVFVKPASMGSSIGISRVAQRDDLDGAVDQAARYDEELVFEHGVDGREIEVAVLGNDEPEVSVPGEIVSPSGFYDYAEKYENDHAGLVVPAALAPDEIERLGEVVRRVYRALRVQGMARVDCFLDATGAFLVNEVNTVPGFTPISMYPRLWEASGLSTPELLDRLVGLALERHSRHHAGEQGRGAP
ncbi:MAG: D-alanine--D-alanine ligase [Actinomycetota bacterium]|nr:D-alanine--D-alanine ligase [Actinomycetota bacterium]